MIPAQFNPSLSPGQVGQAGRAQQMNMPTNVTSAFANTNQGNNWNGSNWPVSLGTATGLSMGTSPFGRSVDMVDMATQLMEAGGDFLLRTPRPCVCNVAFINLIHPVPVCRYLPVHRQYSKHSRTAVADSTRTC